MKSHQNQFPHGDLTDAILGAFYSVHSRLGYGFLEGLYANAISILIRNAGMRVDREQAYEVLFDGQRVGFYRADLVVQSAVIVEVKTAQALSEAHAAQVLNYLRASNLEVGLVLNFGQKAEFRRVVSTARRQ